MMHNTSSLDKNLTTQSNTNAGPVVNNENNMKNISPYMSKDMIAAAGFNVETPIVNAIIGNLAGTLPRKKNEELIKCEICACELPSDTALNFHINGSRHQKRLKAIEVMEQLKKAKEGVSLGLNSNPNTFKCEICSLTVNSALQLEFHLAGAKHKKKISKVEVITKEPEQSVSNNIEKSEDTNPIPAKKKKKDASQIMACNVCDIILNSETQFNQHLLSKKHYSRITARSSKGQFSMKGRFMKLSCFKRGGILNSKIYKRSMTCKKSSRQSQSQKYRILSKQ